MVTNGDTYLINARVHLPVYLVAVRYHISVLAKLKYFYKTDDKIMRKIRMKTILKN